MFTIKYCRNTESERTDVVFSTLIFYETSRFQKDLQTGKYLSDSLEERSFVASLADAADEVIVIAECRVLQPDALPGEIEAYGQSVIQIDCVYEEPEYADAGAAEVLITALPDVVKELYSTDCHVIIFPPVPEAHTDLAGTPDYEIERFVSRLGKIGRYRIIPSELLMIEGVKEKISAIDELFDGYDGAYKPEETIKGTCGREMI